MAQPEIDPRPQPVDVYRNDPVTPLENQTPQQAYGRKKAIFRTYQVVWYILGLIEVLLAFRFFLRLVGANPGSGFVDLIYTISAPFAVPFRGIVPVSQGESAVVEWSTLIAMLVYLVVAWGIVKLFQLVKPVGPEEVESTVDKA
jgi:uncharacterized protein YggT (Ycf19 family)